MVTRRYQRQQRARRGRRSAAGRRAASSAGVSAALLLVAAAVASDRLRCDSLTAEGRKATDFLNGLPGAAAWTSEPADPYSANGGGPRRNPARRTADHSAGPRRSRPAATPCASRDGPRSGPFPDQTPPASRTNCCFPWSAWVQLLYHQQTKNLLAPKRASFRPRAARRLAISRAARLSSA